MLKLKLQYFERADSLEKTLMLGKIEGRRTSALSFLHSPTLISTHDHWKNHSFD